MATPAMPATSPATVNRLGRSPATIASNRAIQMGVVATTSAAIPLAISSSPRTTPPLPPSRSSVPMTMADHTCRRLGRSSGVPRRRCHATSARRRTTPAVAYRNPAETSGGRVWTMTAMPR